MLILFSIIILFYCVTNTGTRDVEVMNSGLMKIKQSDMMVIFYVTVRNNAEQPLRAMLNAVECCETVTDQDVDCDLMDLYGGDFGVVQPGAIMNFTLIYPNLYGYNRRGSCLVNILHRNLGSFDSEEFHHRIDFDTRTSTEEVPSTLKGWYDPRTFVNCESPDLDPFDHCNPVDCHLKYSGYRNFYNMKWKMCQRVPTCLADPNKELPDVAYMPNSNTCRNLDGAISKKDVDLLSKGKVDIRSSEPKMANVRCHHGEMDPKTGLCVCERGWKSEPFSEDATNGIYSMCTIKCHEHDDGRVMSILLGFFLALWVLFCVICCEKLGFFCPEKRNAENYGAQAAVYFPLRGSECTTVASVLASTKNSFPDGYKSKRLSPASTPFCHSEKTISSKGFLRSSKSSVSFSSGKHT